MGRASHLSENEKTQISTLHGIGWSLNEIAKKIGRSKTAVFHEVQRMRNPVPAETRGRKEVLSARDKRTIINKASNNTIGVRKLAIQCPTPISKNTAWRALGSTGFLVQRKMKKAPALTRRHKDKRVDFARLHMTMDWTKVVFSDEKKWNFDGPDGLRCYWRDLRKDPRIFSTRGFGGGTLMCWGSFHASGTFDLQFTSSRMNSRDYISIVSKDVIPFFNSPAGTGFTYQQDNAPIHRSRETMNEFNAHNIPVLPWPALSPDLNPIENVWGLLARNVYANGRQFTTIPQLQQVIVDEWAKLSPAYLSSLASSMTSRIFDVIRSNGDAINY